MRRRRLQDDKVRQCPQAEGIVGTDRYALLRHRPSTRRGYAAWTGKQ